MTDDQNKAGTAPISIGGPEHEPMDSSPEGVHELIEHPPDPEVSSHVEVIPEVVTIPDELKSIGVESTGTPVFKSIDPNHLPLTDEQIFNGEKAPPSSAIRWLREMCLRALLQMGKTLKLIHGKVTRVPSS